MLSLSMWMFAACAPARADIVFDNLSNQSGNGATNGVSIGASLLIGSTPLSLTDIIFAQLSGTNRYTAGETFSINARNPDGTVGAALFSSFTLINDAPSGQTNVFPTLPVVLLPDTGYWLIVSATTGTGWTYTLGSGFNSSLGVTVPADPVAYTMRADGSSAYFTLAQGPQLLRVDATATTVPVVPEPSSWCLLALLGSSLGFALRRGLVRLKSFP